MMNSHTNALINASSPYLLQHAHNPVNWVEWSDEAFERAKDEDKLVLISIGYSSCHWCHVMERECFEKEDTAAIMNEHFVCIKVDREERPDVDQLYMDAVQLLTGRGGWPLNCFALPDGRPVHGGTYFPKAEWEQVLKSLAAFYENNKEEALNYATELTQGIRKLNLINNTSDGMLTVEELNNVINSRKNDFDDELGGFSWAPKFPMPVHWEMFMQQYYYTRDEDFLNAVNITLTKMAEGGIYDQVGGGFSRYSVDVFWKVPHFEKMLYDNAQLVSVYCQAYQLTKNDLYKKTVVNTLEFIKREMTSAEGLFYSALDADSEGVEGKFYVWKKKELQHLLGDDEPLYSLYFSVDAYGNWEHENNILYKTRNDEEIAVLTGKSINEIDIVIKRCNEKLLKARESRIRPGLDDKAITSWNALMIKAYADAYLVFNDNDYLKRAVKAADFIAANMWSDDQLFRIYKNNKASINAYAEDYALLCEAMIRLYEASNDETYMLFAKQLLDSCIADFYNEDVSAFNFKSKRDKQLVSSKTDMNDDVIPSSNSVLAKCLLTLSFVFDNASYKQKCDNLLKLVTEKARRHPASCSNWLQLILTRQHGFRQVVIAGKNSFNQGEELRGDFIPSKIVLKFNQLSKLPLLKEKGSDEKLRVYICTDETCGLPSDSVEQAIKSL